VTLLAFLFCNSFGYVALKAIQQKNVTGDHYFWLGPVSLGMAFGEVFGVTAVISNPDHKVLAALAIGSGAWLGCVCAMKSHAWIVRHNWHKPAPKGR
jgi:formate-dependent nitrite reductase membrane component NrfD